jgi:peptide/nickel transport system substrate-binding protein
MASTRFSSGAETFDPALTSSLFTTSVAGPIYEELFQFFPPDGALKPYLLESAVTAPDGMSWTLKLRQGITFSNGDPMTADDVKFSLERFMSTESVSASKAELVAGIGSIAVVDPLTVRLDLKRPMLTLPNTLTYAGNEGVVMPSKYIQQVGWSAFADKPIGSGPYVVTEHTAGQSVTYKANPKYWGGPQGNAKPSLDQINVVFVSEEQTRISMLHSGQADITEITSANKSDVESSGVKTLVVPNSESYMLYPLGTYADDPDNPLKKLEVRKALTLALDKKALVDALSAGTARIASFGPLVPDPAHGVPDLPPTAYDPDQARQLLQQAGYPNGLTIKVWALDVASCNPTIAKQFAEAVGGYWQKIGVTAEVVPISFALLRPKIQAFPHAPDTVGSYFTFCLGGPNPAALQLNATYFGKGNFHLTNVADTESAAALAASTVDEQNRQASAAFQKLYDNYSATAIYFGGRIVAVSKKAEGYPITPGMPDMLQWWVTPRP